MCVRMEACMESMDEKPRKRVRRRGRGRWVVFSACLLVFLCLLASYVLRTSAYLSARLAPKLEALGERVGGSFSFERIHAMGLTGIVLEGVRFEPRMAGGEALGAFEFASVTVYPDLPGMFVGDLNASSIEGRGLRGDVVWGEGPHSHEQWFRQFQGRLESERGSGEAMADAAGPGRVPEVHCIDCRLGVMVEGQSFRVDVPLQTLRLSEDGGEGFGAVFLGEWMQVCRGVDAEEETCFEFLIADMRILGGGLWVDQCWFRGAKWHGVVLEQLSLRGIFLSRDAQRDFISIEAGEVKVQIEESSALSRLSGTFALVFDQLELLRERVSNRWGYGVMVREEGEKWAKLFGGYDPARRVLAVTLESRGLDYARFGQQADFSKHVSLLSLPVDGQMRLVADLAQEVYHLDVDVHLREASVHAPAIASEPLEGIRASVAFAAGYDAADRTVWLDEGKGVVGEIGVLASFSRSGGEKGGRTVNAKVEVKGEGEGFVGSLPRGFAPALAGYVLEGPYRLALGLSYREDNLDELSLTTDFDLDSVRTVAFDPRSNFELLKTDDFLVRIHAATVPKSIGPRDSQWVKFYDLPREVAYAFVASEDGKFFSHGGMDLRAIRGSLVANLKADRVVRGGSTISQQVVKNLFLNHDKTLSRKFQEAFLTWQMEKTLPKIRIFELYLNLAHWAKDIYGIREAAAFYFSKTVSQLSLREALFLASILPNPIIFGKQYAQNELSSSRIQKMVNVGNALRATNRISASAWEAALPLIREGKISDRPRPVVDW